MQNTGADPETFERGGVDQKVVSDIPYISVQRALKWRKPEVSIFIRDNLRISIYQCPKNPIYTY